MGPKKACANCGRVMSIHSAGLCGGCATRSRGLSGVDRERVLAEAKADFQGQGSLVRKRGEDLARSLKRRECRNCGRNMVIAQDGLCGGCWNRTKGLTGEEKEKALALAREKFKGLQPGQRAPQINARKKAELAFEPVSGRVSSRKTIRKADESTVNAAAGNLPVRGVSPWAAALETLRDLPGIYEGIGAEIGRLVDRKQNAYGQSFNHSGRILTTLYPYGIKPEQYGDLLAMVRIIDKMFRISTDKDALGEDPWTDIAGYALLMNRDEAIKEVDLHG